MKKILISNVGNSDPVRDGRDGPALHISRVYMPDKIYLICTKEMKKNASSTQFQIELLYSRANKTVELELIKLDVENPASFDELIHFEKIHNEIETKHKDDDILINITSGTPQMISSVCLDIVVNKRGFKPIQVYTPNKGANTNIPHTVVDDAWDIDATFDRYDEWFENRCVEPNIFLFRNSFLKAKLEKLVKAFNYKEVVDKVKEIKNYKELKLFDFLSFVNDYYNLNEVDLFTFSKENRLQLSNITDSNLKLIIQAYNVLDIKCSKNEYLDFSNRITPLLFLLSKKILLSSENGAELYSKCIIKNDKTGVEYISYEKVKKHYPNLIAPLFNMGDKDMFLSFKHLITIFESEVETQTNISDFRVLREFEEKIRNSTAHTLKNYTKEYIKSTSGHTPEHILETIKQIIMREFKHLGVKDFDLSFFKNANKIIIENIRKL